MKIIQADRNDIPELYRLQLLAFESEAEMIGSRDVPALHLIDEVANPGVSGWLESLARLPP